MDLASFTNLNNETASQCIKEAAKEAMLTMWGGKESSLKEDAAEIFGNTFAQMFSETFIPQLSENIVNLIESAAVEGFLQSVNPMVQGEYAICELAPTPGTSSGGPNVVKIKCI